MLAKSLKYLIIVEVEKSTVGFDERTGIRLFECFIFLGRSKNRPEYSWGYAL